MKAPTRPGGSRVRALVAVAAALVAVATLTLLWAPSAARHAAAVAQAGQDRNAAHGAAWDTYTTAVDAADAAQARTLDDAGRKSGDAGKVHAEKVAQARAPHDKAAREAADQNAVDAATIKQAEQAVKIAQEKLDAVPRLVEQDAQRADREAEDQCIADHGLWLGASSADLAKCRAKGETAGGKVRAQLAARVKAAQENVNAAQDTLTKAQAAEAASRRAWEAAYSAAEAAEAGLGEFVDPLTVAAQEAQAHRDKAEAAARATLDASKSSADDAYDAAVWRAGAWRAAAVWTAALAALAALAVVTWLYWPAGRRAVTSDRAKATAGRGLSAVQRAILWETTGVMRFIAWRRQGRSGDVLQRTIYDALIRDLQSGRMTSAEALKAHAQTQRAGAVERRGVQRIAWVFAATTAIWLAQILLKLGGFIAREVPGTVVQSGVENAAMAATYLAPLSWILTAATAVALIVAFIGHTVTLDEPLPSLASDAAQAAATDDANMGKYGIALGAVFGDKYRRAVRDRRVAGPHVEATTNGVRVIAPLPAADGVTADRFDRRTFAANVQRAPGLVRQVDNDEDLGTLTLLVMDHQPGPPQYPHTACATGDPHAPSPLGVTIDDRPVDVTLCETRSGAVHAGVFGPTGSGKSFTARVLHLPLIRAQRHTVWVVDLKASPEWRAIAPALDRHVETVRAAVTLAAQARALVDERKGSRVTHDPVRLIVDETEPLRGQNGFWDDIRYIVKLGRAFNIGVTLCSQESTVEASGIPADIVRQLGAVWLGAGTRSALSNAVGMSMPDADLGLADAPGMGWFKHTGAPGRKLVRAYLVTDDEAARILGVEASAAAYDEARADAASAAGAAEERDPAELAAEDLRIEFGERAALTLDEAREVLGDDTLTVLLDALPAGNNGRHDRVKRDGRAVAGIRRERLERYLEG